MRELSSLPDTHLLLAQAQAALQAHPQRRGCKEKQQRHTDGAEEEEEEESGANSESDSEASDTDLDPDVQAIIDQAREEASMER